MNVFPIPIEGVLWKIHCHWNLPCLILEERLVESHQLTFRGIDVHSGKVLFKVQASNWWESYIGAYDSLLFTTTYPEHHLPYTQGIFAYHSQSGQIAWQKPELDWVGIDEEGCIFAKALGNSEFGLKVNDLEGFAALFAKNLESESAFKHVVANDENSKDGLYKLDFDTGTKIAWKVTQSNAHSYNGLADLTLGLITGPPYLMQMPEQLTDQHALFQLAQQTLFIDNPIVEMAIVNIHQHQLAIVAITAPQLISKGKPLYYHHQLLFLENNQYQLLADLGVWQYPSTCHIGISFGNFGCFRTANNLLYLLNGLK